MNNLTVKCYISIRNTLNLFYYYYLFIIIIILLLLYLYYLFIIIILLLLLYLYYLFIIIILLFILLTISLCCENRYVLYSHINSALINDTLFSYSTQQSPS